MINKELLKRLVSDYQYRKAVCYPKTNERIYCNLRVCYIIFFVYLTIMNVLTVLGMANARIPSTANAYMFDNLIVGTVLFAVAFILMFFKLNLISFVLNIAAAVFKFPLVYYGLIYDVNTKMVNIQSAFYWQHLIPFALIFIVSLWMCIISTREKYLIRRDTKAVLSEIYDIYHTDSMSEDEWKDFLSNYKGEKPNSKNKKLKAETGFEDIK